MWEISCISDKGLVREKNDDRVMACNTVISLGKYSAIREDNFLVVLCDGVGGEKHGDEAAEIVARSFQNISAAFLDSTNIQTYIDSVNEKVIAAQHIDAEHSKMATTIAGIAISGNDFLVFNVGDTRVYRYRPPYISQMSIDHSLARELISVEVDINDLQKHIITRCLGGECATAHVIEGKDSIGNNDVFFLCTDGVWNVIDDIDFENVLSSTLTSEKMRDQIFDLAIKNKTDDNISIVIIRRV